MSVDHYTTPFPSPTWAHHSDLKWFALSPLHYRAKFDPDYVARLPHPSSPAMVFGTLVHSLTLGGRDLPIVWTGGHRRGKAWEEFQAEHADREICTEAEMRRAEKCALAILDHAEAGPLLLGNGAVVEEAIEWIGPNGRKCAGRIDSYQPGEVVVDLKTTRCAEPGWFVREALRRLYHAQMSFYFDALEAVGRPVKKAKIVAVESVAPFDVTIFELTERALDDGRKRSRAWLERLAVCESAGQWPGYTQSEVPLDVEESFELVVDGETLEF